MLADSGLFLALTNFLGIVGTFLFAPSTYTFKISTNI